MKVGILGGTFDPIHLGHTFIAKKAQETLGLDEIWFVPAGDPWLKRDREISLAKHRLEMVCLAVEEDQTFKVLDIEVRRPGPSYTVDTLSNRVKQTPLFIISPISEVINILKDARRAYAPPPPRAHHAHASREC